ncbi:MAG: CpsD/CapB family tyrosine-protein kinase [Bacilli bacterium]|nr:CpsD/CapB family tyrosine-protein kinase [Bacilli bacterium]
MKNKDLVINRNPKSLFAESIRSIRTNLAFSSLDKDIKIIINTSPEASDGKSFVTANLAVAYAQEGKKVLLIDADLRRGRQHEIFEIMNVTSGGYSNLMLNYKENIPLEKYIFPTFDKNIDLLPTGPMPPNPVELLASENNKMLLDRLKRKYDLIIMDCAPVIGLSDSLILATMSDINMLTVSAKKTKMENLERAKKQFEQANTKINGVILNKAPMQGNGYYSYYYNNDYYGDQGNN